MTESNKVAGMKNLAVIEASDIRPLPVETIKARIEELDQIKELIARPTDGYMVNGKRKPDKDYLRRYGRCFGLSYEVTGHQIFRDEKHKVISADFEVRVHHPCGAFADGHGTASQYEGRGWNKDGDIPATARTRAISSAIDDLLAVGSLSTPEGSTFGTDLDTVEDADFI